MDSQIEAYIQKQKSPQKEIIIKVREIFRETLPIIEEKKAWGVITYAGGKFYLGAINDRVHVGFAIAGLSAEEVALFEGNGTSMRHIKIRTIDEIDKDRLVELIKLVEKKSSCKYC
jgi:hypothetical protein